MNCNEAREVLHRLTDGEFPSDAADARAHVDACRSCAEWESGMARLVRRLSEPSMDRPIPDLSTSIMAMLPARHPACARPSPRRTLWARVAAIVGTVWLLAVLCVAGCVMTLRTGLQKAPDSHLVLRAYDATSKAYLSAGHLVSGAYAAWKLVTKHERTLSGVRASLSGLVIRLLALDCGILSLLVGGWAYRNRRLQPQHSPA